ncbi:MAG TPA: amidohydrolase family protein [Actinomycetota bacterium]|jgi:predicted TIM-barrel fold metal-dependent hydrolase
MQPDRLRDLPLRDYRPRSSLRLPEHHVPRARFPAVDAHNHLGRWLTDGWSAPDTGELVDVMDACGIDAIVNLDGMWGDELQANLDRYDRARPGRFATFCQLDWTTTAEPGFGERLAAQLHACVAEGARGVKVWKQLGLRIRDDRGALVMPDDERLDPVWAAAADAGAPVTIHVADPVAFFEPLDETNERLEELLANPDWWFGDRDVFPPFERIIESFESLVARHPATTFIGAHVACNVEDLAWVDRMLSTYPNLYADVAARIAELGRQPRASRALMLQHPDRIVFGTDLFPPAREIYAIHFRFLETADEHFPYDPDEPPSQGRWAISGLELPDDVLRAVYGDNTRRLIAGLGGDDPRAPGSTT